MGKIVRWFCVVIVAIVLILTGYLFLSTKALKKSQANIVNEHVRHIMKTDSIFYDMKSIILSKDTGVNSKAQILLSQLQRDSSLFRREVLLSQEEMNNLVSLHIEKIEDDYAQIGIWGGVLSIIFIIFGFFAIFKLEETKSEAKDVLKNIKDQELNATKKISELQDQASSLNSILSTIKNDSNSFIADKSKEIDTLKQGIVKMNSEAETNLRIIENLLTDLETKSKQYQLSLETMTSYINQLDVLIDTLKKTMEKGEKETSNE